MNSVCGGLKRYDLLHGLHRLGALATGEAAVGTGLDFMCATADRLRKLGLDVDFLIWLEGAEDRLPHLDQLAKVNDADFTAAVRAAVWLTSQFADPAVVDREVAEGWRQRYQLFEALLWNALRYSMVSHRLDRPNDLEALERVLDLLLPRSRTIRFREDLHKLRSLGRPERLADLAQNIKKLRKGGRRVSEQVQRMRAAVEYLRAKSNRPYRDLERLWNESIGEGKPQYEANQVRQALRKGEQVGTQLLEFWMAVYEGEHYRAFPGLFP